MIKIKTSISDKDFTEQLAEYKVLDKVVPCLDQVGGVFVQITKNQEFATVVELITPERLVLKSISGIQFEAEISQVKFLAVAYVLPLNEIAIPSASDPLAIDLALTEQSDLSKNIVIIQVINTPSQNDADFGIPVGSIHRMNAILMNPITEKFCLYPVSILRSRKIHWKQQLSPEFDDNLDNPEHFAYRNAKTTQQVLEFARKISQAYQSYKQKVENIPLNADNYQQLLYSLCIINKKNENQSQNKYGILTRYQNDKAFVRYLKSKAESSDAPQEWLNLDQFEIHADISVGFVSQSTLAQRTIFDTKLRNLKFVSQIESKSQLNQQLQDSTKEFCKKCNFLPVQDVRNLVCAGCGNWYHEKCLKDYQTKHSESTAAWHCPQCIKCVNCKACSQDLLPCQICNVPYHFECLDDQFKQKLKSYQELQHQEFKCENCLACQSCKSREAQQNGAGTWSYDFKFCSICDSKRDKNMYCIGCLKLWEDSEDLSNMISCIGCQMQIHPSCDRMLEEPQILEKFKEVDEEGKPKIFYACYFCRQKARADFVGQIVGYMMNEDKREEFKDRFWLQANNQIYLSIIKNPLCFNMIKQDIDDFISGPLPGHKLEVQELKYLSIVNKLQSDIDLIFQNAKTFNQPQTDIHKLAVRMHEKCKQILSQGRISEILRDNCSATHDELLYLKQIRGIATGQTNFKLKSKDLFQNQEQIDVCQYQYMLANQDEQVNLDGVQLGKRQREIFTQISLKRQRTDLGETLVQTDPTITLIDAKKLFSEANKRLLEQNLSKIRQNLQPLTNFSSDKPNFKLNESDLAQVQWSPRSRWRALMDSLRLNEDKDNCWYSNPVRVSFNDPSLIFEEMCYLCGSFGLREEFLTCNLCCESFHSYCLPYPKDMNKIDIDKWLCYNCVFCEKCHSSKQYESLILCSICEKADHYWCLEPKLVSLPDCSWKCPDCFQCKFCGTKEFFSVEDVANKVNLDPNQKYVLSFDFEFCFQCGQDQYRKSFCSICQQQTGLGISPQTQKKNLLSQVQLTSEEQCHQQELYKCQTCKFYSHLSCSRTNQSVMQQLGQQSYFNGYQCLDCLLNQKLPGFFLQEQCEIYEDLHIRMEKYQLIAKLCFTILQKYSNGNQLVLEQYVEQNYQWLSSDSLVRKWVQLIRSEVDYETSESSQQNDQQETQQIVETFSEKGLKELTNDFFQNSEYDHTMQDASKPPREMYLNLYRKSYSNQEIQKSIPPVEFNDDLLKPNFIDFPELYVSLEMMAIIKIRTHFFNWIENSLVGPAIKYQELFFKQLNQNQVNNELMNTEIELEKVNTEQMIVDQDDCLQTEEICSEEDVTIVNPQNKLTCILCQQSGEKRITGRLIPFQVNQFVHVYCALWTAEVKEMEEDLYQENHVASELYNLYFAFKAFRNNVCAFCGLKGATLICCNHQQNKKCNSPYFHFPCAYQSGVVSFQTGLEVFCEICTKKEKSLQAGLPIKFRDYHRRRFIIVKNIKPLETNLFDTEVGENGNNLIQSGQQYVGTCNKWRPYYYDMFNRAGNLTIISLSQQANRIIETLHNQQYQQVTWHDRLKKHAESEQPQEFASIRISWKDFEKGKGFFLFTKNEAKILNSKDVHQIVPYMSKQLNKAVKLTPEKTIEDEVKYSIEQFWQQQIGIVNYHFKNFSEDSTYQRPQNLQGLNKYPIQYWNDPAAEVGVPLRDLQVANFFYKSAELVIERQKLYNQRSQTEPQVQFEQLPPLNDLQNVFKKILDANKFVDIDGFTAEEAENLSNPKWKNPPPLTELQLKQKLSSLNRSQTVLNQLSAKQMNYGQIMGCLGKRTMTQRKKMRQAQQRPDDQIFSFLNNSANQKANERLFDSEDEQKKTATALQQLANEEARLNQDVSQGKSVEQNLQMRYRAMKEKVPLVEVWTSKIHRNGLFACQAFNPKDAVIEYVGEKIRVPVADLREKSYEKIGVGDCYLFSLDREHIIDATFYGNKARYINHSCEPNLASEKLSVNGETHIIFIALRHIKEGEELTFDYKFDYEANSKEIECFCMSANCRGRLN